MASLLPDDMADVPAFTNQPSWSQPEEAADMFNPIDFMDNDEEVRQSKNDDEAAKYVDNDEEVRQSKDDDEAAKLVAAEKESKAKKTKNTALIIGAIFVVAAIAVGVGVGVGVGVSSSSSNSVPDPTAAPTLPPTPAPALVERDSMISLIQSRSASTTFTNSSSPQSQSLDWILSDPFSSDGLSDDRLVQRFALATLYYSMDGDNWDRGGWLESKNECAWNDNDFICSQESAVEGLRLFDDSLSGRIPIELGLLTQLTFFSLYDNQLTGSIPSELGLLTQLLEVYLETNQLTGSLPSEFGLLNQPTRVGLSGNELTGFIPSELGFLTQLTRLDLYTNRLTGSIPSELGLLTQLYVLELYDNELTGSIPPSFCSAIDYIHIDCLAIACACCRSGVTGGSC